MLAVARSPALNASAPDALVRSDAPSPACIPEKEYIDRSLTNFRIGLININEKEYIDQFFLMRSEDWHMPRLLKL